MGFKLFSKKPESIPTVVVDSTTTTVLPSSSSTEEKELETAVGTPELSRSLKSEHSIDGTAAQTEDLLPHGAKLFMIIFSLLLVNLLVGK